MYDGVLLKPSSRFACAWDSQHIFPDQSTVFRLIISPILSREDRIAIENGLQTVDEVTTSILENLFITEDLLVNHTLKCLTWLLRQSQIEIKIALMKDALFHPKAWMFKCGDDVVVAHGSSNATAAGLSKT